MATLSSFIDKDTDNSTINGSDTNTDTNTNTNAFPKFLIAKCADPDDHLSKKNLILAEKAFTGILGKDHECTIKALRSGVLLIEVHQKWEAEILMATTKLATIDVCIEPHKTLNTSKGVVYCRNLEGYVEDEAILEVLKEQNPNLIEVHRIRSKRQGVEVPSNILILTFGTPQLPKEVKIGYMIEKVRLYIPNPRRCFNCQDYGHGKDSCKHSQRCAKCGDEGHDFVDCVKPPKCCHCPGDHAASDRSCPKFILEKKATELKIVNGITYFAAKKKVLTDNPDLAKKLPNEKVDQNKTWSDVVASQPTSPPAQSQVSVEKADKQHAEMMSALAQIMTTLTSLTELIVSKIPTVNVHSEKQLVIETDQVTEMESTNVVPKRTLSTSSNEDEPYLKIRGASNRPEDLNKPAVVGGEKDKMPLSRGRGQNKIQPRKKSASPPGRQRSGSGEKGPPRPSRSVEKSKNINRSPSSVSGRGSDRPPPGNESRRSFSPILITKK